MSKTFKLDGAGLEVVIGKYATQADGSAWLQCGSNILLATVTATKEQKDFMGFFPLTVEYREKAAAAGKIPGGYIKREGRLSDHEVLTSRLTDRTIRPFFPSHYFNEVQLLATVYSSDGNFPSGVLSILGSSLALTVSKLPFKGPIGAVHVSRVDGQWAFNLSNEQAQESDVSVLVAGTQDSICMVEGNCNELSEDEMVDLLFSAEQEIRKQVVWQNEIAAELGIQKEMPKDTFDWSGWTAKIAESFARHDVLVGLFGENKVTRKETATAKKELVKSDFTESLESGELPSSIFNYLYESVLKDKLPDEIVARQRRFDGRTFTEVRPVSSEIGLLPQSHGSATFKRGETLALSSLTLGTGQDAQKVETLNEGMQERSFMLHYNFPPFAVGEVRPIRGVGRREIGHGYLAQNSFKHVLPSQEDFPYTIRSVVDILDCNGSSSMATVCATTLSLMDAGVPLRKMVAGIAMGLIQDSSGTYQIMTDILGAEDALGLMDFKVTGTDAGIMAIQMDIKAKDGLSRELLQQALHQAREARNHILNKMSEVIDNPRNEVSAHAPKVVSFTVSQDKIGAIIGPSGKTIKEIIAQTETQIDIDNDGIVKIYSKDAESAKAAERWVRVLAGELRKGMKFNGIIRRFVEFGMFVELVPGKDGLIHISNIDKAKQHTLEQDYKIGDKLEVEVIDFESETGRVKIAADELLPEHKRNKS